jgi:hypothetical protein
MGLIRTIPECRTNGPRSLSIDREANITYAGGRLIALLSGLSSSSVRAIWTLFSLDRRHFFSI